MLRIPGAGDRPQPLVMRRTEVAGEDMGVVPGAEADGGGRRKRKRRQRGGSGHAWENESGRRRHGGGRERRQMQWMLCGVALLLALIVTGVWLAMRGGPGSAQAGGAPVLEIQQPVAQPADSLPAEPATDGVAPRNDAEWVREAEPLARRFLEARKTEELLPLVRQPKRVAERMKRLYPDGTVDAPGMSGFNVGEQVIHQNHIALVQVRTGDYEERQMAFADTPDGLRIDWESWVGWSDLAWDEFMEKKPAEPARFRVHLGKVEYYNRDFSDDDKWQSYRLESPDGEQVLYGYAERGGVLGARLRPAPDAKKVPWILSLKFPQGATARDQVIIDGITAEGWVLEQEEPPP